MVNLKIDPVAQMTALEITCEAIEPRWRAIGAERPQFRYRAIVDGVEAGEIVVVELQAGLAFVAWVHVHPAFRRRGIALTLHTRAAAVHGTLAVEDFANPEELALWDKLATRGWGGAVGGAQTVKRDANFACPSCGLWLSVTLAEFDLAQVIPTTRHKIPWHFDARPVAPDEEREGCPAIDDPVPVDALLGPPHDGNAAG